MHGPFPGESLDRESEAYLDAERGAAARTARLRAAERPGSVRFEEELALIASMPPSGMREQVVAWRAYASGESDAYRELLYAGWEDGDFERLLAYARQWSSKKGGK